MVDSNCSSRKDNGTSSTTTFYYVWLILIVLQGKIMVGVKESVAGSYGDRRAAEK